MQKSLAVLNIDDSERDSKLVADLLKKADYTITFKRIETAAQMRTALKKRAWDLIIADCRVPKFDGYSALALLQEAGLDIPFIALADSRGQDVAAGMMKAGAQDCVFKDYLTRLIPAVERELEGAEVRRERTKIESLYRSLTEDSFQGVAIYQGRKMVFANPAICRIFGYTDKELMAFSEEKLRALIHPHDRKISQERSRKRGAGEAVPPFVEVRMLRKDGSTAWVQVINESISYEEQPAILSLVIDITESRVAQEQINLSERRFRALIENSLDDISVLSADGTLIWESPSVSRNLQYAPGALVGRDIFEIIHPADQGLMRNLFAQLIQQPDFQPEATFRVRRGDQTWRWVEGSGKNMLNEPGIEGIVVNYRDVTERKHSEEVLRKSEERFHSLFDNMMDGVYRSTLEGRFVDVNPALVKMLGYSSREEMLELDIKNDLYFEPERRSTVNLKPGDVETSVFRLRGKDGSEIWVEDHGSYVFDEQGRIIFHEGILRDITVSRRIEATLRESEENYRLLFESNPQPMWIYDAESLAFLLINDAAIKQYGYSTAEFMAMTIKDIRPPEDIPGLLESATHLSNGTNDAGVWRHHRKDGSLIQVNIVTHNLEFAGRRAKLVLANDISERKRAEEALRESEEKYRMIVETMTEGIWVVDKAWRTTYANPALAAMLRYTQAELLGHSPMEFVDREDTQKASMLMERREKGVTEKTELGMRRKDNTLMLAQSTSVSLLNGEGEFAGGLSLVADITERKQAEEEIKSLARFPDENPSPIVRLNGKGKILYANRASKALLEDWEAAIGGTAPAFWLRKITEVVETNAQQVVDVSIKESIFSFLVTPIIETGYVNLYGGDITDLKRAESLARESEERYRSLFEDSPVALWEQDFSAVKEYLDVLRAQGITDFNEYFNLHPQAVIDCASRAIILDVNKATLKLFGAAKKQDLLKNLAEFLEGEPVRQFQTELVHMAEGKTSFGWDAVIQTLDGRLRNIELNWHAISHGEHPLSKVIVSMTDITERKRSEDALRTSEERLQLGLNMANIAMFNQDLDLRYTWMYQPQLGYTTEQVVGHTDADLLPPEAAKQLTDIKRRILESGLQEHAEIPISSDGQNLTFDFNAGPLRDASGAIIGLTGASMDITERKRSEEIVRESDQRFHSLFDHMMDGVYRSKPEGVFVEVNPAMARIFGYAGVQEMLAVDIKKELYFAPEERGSHILDTGREEVDVYRMRRKDGSEIWVEDHGSYIHDEQGKIVYHEGILRDVTERKRSENYLQALNDAALAMQLTTTSDEIFAAVSAELAKVDLACNILVVDESGTNLTPKYLSYDPTAIRAAEKLTGLSRSTFHISIASVDAFRRPIIEREAIFLESAADIVQQVLPARVKNFAGKLTGVLKVPKLINSPMIVGNKVIGLFSVTSKDLRPSDLPAMTAFANQLAAAWQRSELFEQSHKEAEAREHTAIALRESERRFQLASWVTKDVIWERNLSTNTIIWNDSLRKIFHFPEGSVKPTVEWWQAQIHPADRPKVVDSMQTAMEEGLEFWSKEYRFQLFDGAYADIFDRGYILRDEQGAAIEMVGAMIDITDRKRAEASVLKSEKRYRALFENMPVAIWEEDFSAVKSHLDSLKEHGVNDLRAYFASNPAALSECNSMIRILDVNQAALTMYGAASKEDLLNSVAEVPNDRLIEQISNILIAISEGKSSHAWEGADETVSGIPMEIELSWSVAPGHEHDLSKVIVTTIDITKRKRDEEALQASEAQFRAIFEGAAIGIAIVDLSGRPMKTNRALQDLLGYDSAELARMVFTEFTHPDDVPLDLYLWHQMAAGQRDHYQIEKRYFHKDGQVIWGKLAISPVAGADGNMVYAVGMIEDITEAKRAEAEIKYQLAELETLYENGLAISRLLEPKRIAQRMVEIIDQKLDWHHAAIRLYDPSSDRLELLALNSSGFDEEQTAEQIERINQTINTPDTGLSGWVIRHPEVVRVGKLSEDPRYLETYPGIKSGLYLPIISGDEVIGSIAVESDQEDAFTARDEHTLATLANQAAISFANARLYALLQKELNDRHLAEEKVHRLNIELEKRVEERTTQIEATKRRLELAAEAGQIGVWEYIPRENKVIWDERMHLLHQIPVGGFDGSSQTWARLIHPDDFGDSALNEQLAITNKLLLSNEHRILWPDGSVRIILTSSVTTYADDGKPERVIGINMDITERKQIEQSLRESESYARLLFDAVPDPVSVTESDDSIVDINKEFEKQFSITAAEIRGHTITALGIYPDSEIEKRAEYLSNVLAGVATKPIELDFYVAGDRVHTLELHSYLIEVNGKRLMLNTSHDITSHKKAEEAQRLAKSEMEKALRIKNEFLANMSHELRTPLNSILGISESLEEQIAGALNDKQLKYVGIVRESGRHLLELINDILDLSKIEAGRLELDIQPINVDKLCQSSLRMIKELAQKKSLIIAYNHNESVKLVSGDERRLKQSLVNLLSNAVKFTPPGCRIGLEVVGDAEKNEVSFTVWDQGIGIAEDDVQQLFKPFVQLDAGLTREYQGTGLGLALVAQIAHLHGGRVNLESQPGSGSRFTITLPWSEHIQSEKPIPTGKLVHPTPVAKLRNGRILLVEDTDVVIQLISEYLRYKGYEVMLAHNGLMGVEMAAREHPDMILMDVMMPIMNGFEATEAIRKDVSLKDTPIVALTALAMPGDSERCLAAGMNDYLSKPIQMQDLATMIEKYMKPIGEESNE